MKRIVTYLKREMVLCAAAFLALLSMFFVKPDRGYVDYLDARVLALLFCLMTVMEGFKKTGLFEQMANRLLKKVKTFRQLMIVLVGLCFFSSMWITNDVALLTFVPFTILVLRMAQMERRMIAVVTMETIAANLGSMATPVGNPQNLYLYSVSGMSLGEFIKVMGPLSVLSLFLILMGCLLQKNQELQITVVSQGKKEPKIEENLLLCALFVVSLLAVLRILSWQMLLGITILACLLLYATGKEEFLPGKVDYGLLFTFVAFFIFIGNMGRIGWVKLNINYMLHEDYGHYSYTEHYSLGDIFIYTSADEEKGVLLELKGRGCRQFESYLLAQQRSWYDFLMDALVDGGVMKRIDLAINDHTGILDIPELAEKCRKREYIGKSRSYKFYQSGELIKHREDDREYMGRTLYLGSLKSDVYFCIYEKDYEQYVKLGTPLEEADIINRFEIRLRNERAYYAVRDLLTYYDAEQTAFSIINQYVRFVDEEPDKRKNDWKLNDRWAWFIGDNRQSLKLTTKPEPYTLDRTLRWVQRQVAPTLKMLKKIDKGNGTDYMETIEQQAKLTEKHEMIIKQQTTPAKDLVES